MSSETTSAADFAAAVAIGRAMPLRPELDVRPERIAKLPLYRGYPVPWFVAWHDAAGQLAPAGTAGTMPEFRCMDGAKWRRAVRDRICWVCGEPMGVWLTFLIGPMCGINRVTAEPACHHDCALWSVRNCPFLSKPHMVRRENDLPEDRQHAGMMILRNPGVMLLWVTRGFHLFGVGGAAVRLGIAEPGTLLRIDTADRVEFWTEGRRATRAEVVAAVAAGLPALLAPAEAQDTAEPGAGAVAEVHRMAAEFAKLYPREA